MDPSPWHLPDGPGIISLSAAARWNEEFWKKAAVSEALLSYRAWMFVGIDGVCVRAQVCQICASGCVPGEALTEG